MTPEEAKKSLESQLTDLAKTTSGKIVDDLKDYIADGKHEDMKKLALRALKLKANALLASKPEDRREIIEDLEFTLARIATKIETEKIVLSKTIGATVMIALKTALTVFTTIGTALVSTAIKGAIKGVTGELGSALSDGISGAFAQD